jgi:hypothetical protein
MSIREQVAQELNRLEEPELKQVADYLAFLKFQSRNRTLPSSDSSQWAALYAEFADEDRVMAEAGMAEYATGLAREDAA